MVWLTWLINYIPKPIRKSVSVLKDKFISIFKTNTPKQTVYGRGQKLSKPSKQIIKKSYKSEENKQKIKDRIIRDIWKHFETKEKKRKEKGIREKKQWIIKDEIIRDIRTFLEQQDYYQPKRVSSFLNNNSIEYKSNGDKNIHLSLDKYLNKINLTWPI